MIPKIIHYCWLSDNEFPTLIKSCIETWKKILPEYEFMLWDTNRFPLEDNIWVKQAFEAKKYAFAADYIRLYAVYNYGGIYLDTDIEVLKSFDGLLDRPYFVGAEDDGIIEAGVFASEKGSDWIKVCLDYYNNRKFIKEDGFFDTLTLPRIMMTQISTLKIFKEVFPTDLTPIEQRKNTDIMYMFPKDFFCAKNHGTGVIEKTANTYSIHHFAMSWIDKDIKFLPNIKRKLMALFGVQTITFFIDLFNLRKLKIIFKIKK